MSFHIAFGLMLCIPFGNSPFKSQARNAPLGKEVDDVPHAALAEPCLAVDEQFDLPVRSQMTKLEENQMCAPQVRLEDFWRKGRLETFGKCAIVRDVVLRQLGRRSVSSVERIELDSYRIRAFAGHVEQTHQTVSPLLCLPPRRPLPLFLIRRLSRLGYRPIDDLQKERAPWYDAGVAHLMRR